MRAAEGDIQLTRDTTLDLRKPDAALTDINPHLQEAFEVRYSVWSLCDCDVVPASGAKSHKTAAPTRDSSGRHRVRISNTKGHFRHSLSHSHLPSQSHGRRAEDHSDALCRPFLRELSVRWDEAHGGPVAVLREAHG